jgi:hypothetical protein
MRITSWYASRTRLRACSTSWDAAFLQPHHHLVQVARLAQRQRLQVGLTGRQLPVHALQAFGDQADERHLERSRRAGLQCRRRLHLVVQADGGDSIRAHSVTSRFPAS